MADRILQISLSIDSNSLYHTFYLIPDGDFRPINVSFISR